MILPYLLDWIELHVPDPLEAGLERGDAAGGEAEVEQLDGVIARPRDEQVVGQGAEVHLE